MPLLDHFRPPVADLCQWHSFHSNWATKIVDDLTGGTLPPQYTARDNVRIGIEIATDAGAFDRRDRSVGGTAVAAYAPPAPSATAAVAFVEEDLFEVQVYRREGGWKLVAAVELVSPANKDRPERRRAFAAKCGSLLAAGISLVVVDVVTERQADLHADLVALLGDPPGLAWESATRLSAVAYRVVDRYGPEVDVWAETLAVGGALPTLPLWLSGETAVPLNLERSYSAARRSLQI